MGIRGLTTFVALCGLCEHKTKKFLPSSAQQAKLKLVIDGGALIHHIYFAKRIDFISGGQFDHLEHEATAFFNALIHAGFSPYVIFDGIVPDIKVQECVARQNAAVGSVVNQMLAVDSAPTKQIMTSPILPILAQHVVVHVLNQLKVPYSVSDYEADAVAGTHANKNGCAVLSKDSDFYVFPLAQGYIALDSLSVYSDKLTFDFYKTDSITDLLKLKPELLPAFASLCGNDFVSRESLWGFHMHLRNEYPPQVMNVPDPKCLDIARVGKFLSNYSTQAEAFQAAAEASNTFLESHIKLMAEKELARQAAEAERQAEEAKRAEEARLAAEAKRAEEALRAEELRKEQEAQGEQPAQAPEQQTTKEEAAIQALTESADNIDISRETVDKDDKESKEEKQNEKERIIAMEPEARKKFLLDLLNHSAEQYVAQNVTVGKETSLTLHPLLVPRYFNSNTIPLNLLHQYRTYLFNDELMGVLCKLTVWQPSQVENTARAKSAWGIGLSLRKLTYGILCGGGEYATDPSSSDIAVTEYVREGDKYVATKVTPTYLLGGKKLPPLPTVMGMPPKTRLTIFLEMLSSNASNIVEFEAWTFGIAALRAFIIARAEEKDRKLQEWEVMAIILNFVSRAPFSHSVSLRHQNSLPRNRDQLHFLAEWKVMIYDCVLACNCLLNPITAPSPSALYDGEMILHYLLKCQNKNLDYRKVMLKKPQDIELFDKIFAAVVAGIEDKLAKKTQVVSEADEKKKEIIEKMENKRNAAENKKKAAVKENMFDMLADDEEPQMVKSNSKKAAAKKK